MAMVAMVACGLCGLLVVARARAVARAHLVCLGCCTRSRRRRGGSRGPFGLRGGGDGRGGGERRALHDPIFLRIVPRIADRSPFADRRPSLSDRSVWV